jgi:predicted ATPase
MMTKPIFVLTGAPGSGKSTLLQHLETRGIPVVAEPARQILAEQRSVDGSGIPARDARLFVELLLSRALYEFRRLETATTPVFFDRGIWWDMLRFSGLIIRPEKTPRKPIGTIGACFSLRLGRRFTRRTTSGRCHSRQPAILATRFGRSMSDWDTMGYELIDLPFIPVEERTEFLLDNL